MTKEDDFKRRFAAVLQDLQREGAKDPGTVMLLGRLAGDLAADLKASTWSRAKAGMTTQTYNALLQKLQQEGNAQHAAGRTAHAYAIQAIAFSLVAGTQRSDPDMVTGEQLLDRLIDSTIAHYRSQPKAK